MRKLLLSILIGIGLSTNAQKTISGNKAIPAKKASPTTVKINQPTLKPLESLSDIQIANALFVEIGLDHEQAEDKTLKHYMKNNSKIVNVAEIIHDRNTYYLVDRLHDEDDAYWTGDAYEDKGNKRITNLHNPYSSYLDIHFHSINEENVNQFRVSSRNKNPIELKASTISVTCQKEGDSFVETFLIGYDFVSQYFVKGSHFYSITVDRSGKVTNIKSKDLTSNNQKTKNYNICSERIASKIKNFKFLDDLEAPPSRTYELTITAKAKTEESNIIKFVHEDQTYLSDSDLTRKFYTDSIQTLSKLNEANKNLKSIEHRSDSIYKHLTKNREEILTEFKTNYAAHVEKERQRLIKDQWGGNLDPRASDYNRKLDMILSQAKANADEKFHNLESSTRRDVKDGMWNLNQEYDEVYKIYFNIKEEYESLQRPYKTFSYFPYQ
ncbi:hypothetical protein ACFFLS_19250 [Flavobacterium procerum]|uniref:DUF3826 domain-containing protein n=1 Tax=Flavobacterium procerum TaxID=1455569 RepID=A0ABV6BUT6_9FLAO